MSKIEYSDLLFEISEKLDVNKLPRLLFMCREEIAKGSERNIRDVLTLFQELERNNRLGIDRLDALKEILTQMKKSSLLKKVMEFEIRRKAQSVGIVSSLKRAATCIKGAIKLVCNFRTIAGGLLVVTSGMALRKCSSLDEFVEVFNKVVLVSYSKLVEFSEGSLCFTVQAETSSALKELWNIYKSGTLKKRLQEFLVTDEIKQMVSGEEVEVTVYIDEQEYKAAYLDLMLVQNQASDVKEEEMLGGRRRRNSDSFLCFKPDENEVTLMRLKHAENKWHLERQSLEEENERLKPKIGEAENVLIWHKEESEAGSIGGGKRIRRKSDSDVYFRRKEKVPLLKLKHAETELKFLKDRIAVIEKEIKQFSPEILEACSPEERSTFFKQRELRKASEIGEMDERTDEPEMSQRHKAKLMDPGKLAFVQKYLEDVQDTRSMTTEASDSGLATHPAASVFGTDEINETDKLCLKDLSRDVMKELFHRLEADKATMKKFYHFFGLKMGDSFTSAGFELTDVDELFPDTTVSVLKECFEALRLYDLAEILGKVRPRSLRPAISPEQIEKLRRADDRPTNYSSNVTVLVVEHSFKGDIVKRDEPGKIETFFKGLNSQNEVAIISSASSQETREVLREMKESKRKDEFLLRGKECTREDLEHTLQDRTRLEKELEEVKQMKKGRKQRESRVRLDLSFVKEHELRLRHKLKIAAKERELIDRKIEKLKELEKETEKVLSMAMDEWIHNQEKFTCVAVFIISDDEFYTKVVLEERVVEKLALIPDHAKLVVSPYGWKSIAKVPETLHVMYPAQEVLPVFTRMIEIFNKRWQILDLISMMRELKRTTARHYSRIFLLPFDNSSIAINDSLSTLLTFHKKEETDPF